MAEQHQLKEKLKQDWREEGKEIPTDFPESWDSNVITPGRRVNHAQNLVEDKVGAKIIY